MNNTYIAIGSNKGNKIGFIKNSINYLSEESRIKIVKISSLYYTKPYGITEQENFLNIVLKIKTEMNLQDFHNFCKQTEIKTGREKSYRWGPREIDIDILLFNDLVFDSETLSVPHREILKRDFFLVPLLEIEPEVINPRTKILFKEHLNSLQENYILAKTIFNSNLKGI